MENEMNREPNLRPVPVNAEAQRRPIVIEKGGEVFANSRDVAALFEKEHRNVVQAVDNLLTSLAAEKSAAEARAFVLVPFTDETQPGREFRSFDMTRDGFTLLAMGFTGQKALRWKLRYIEAFNVMEAELRAREAAPINWLDPKNILGFVGALQAEVAKKDAVIIEQGERLQKLNRIEGSKGSVCISTVAKILGVHPIRDLFTLLQAYRWIFKRAHSSNWLGHEDKLRAGLLEHDDHPYIDNLGQERVSTRVLVTPKGLVKIADLLTQKKH